MTSTMDFARGLLQKVSASTKAAREAEKRKQQQAAAARARAAEKEREKERERMRVEANKMIDRNSTRIKRKPSMGKKRVSNPNKPKKQMSPESVAMKLRGIDPKKEGGKPKPRKPTGPPKPLPGMAFVVRRSTKEKINVPHTSDYSDLYGEKFSAGIDVKCVKDMKEESAKATKEAQRIIAERKELADKLMREAEESRKKDEEAERMGIKKDKNEWRKKAAEKEYVSVEAPPSYMTPTEKAKWLKTVESRASSSSAGPSLSVSKGRISKVDAKAAKEREVAKRKAALKDRILAATGVPKAKSVSRAPPSPSRSPERRPVSAVKRKQPLDSERDPYGSRRDLHSSDRRPRSRIPSPKRSRYDDREKGYNSEDWSDDGGSDSDDSEDLFGIDALDREEEESRRWGALEDKMERKRELKHKKEKEMRRKQFEKHR